ncbi:MULTISPECIES: hypothetical protein [Bacillus]|uniref:Uncharacterized protein n=1 Tax=Bacillus glycinifermentans TaxID=1664069 RepID=A0A0T6BI57_9BACI|nr:MULTISPECIES: hypothetical protein [Bacillus]KRT87071.1 hypothetical protein AB447_208880 [Bacillus glycinifermentans]MEC0341875.1 hypothetical protein [Bacillus sonorensis]MEC0457439.1 hypothetical protein [Bacillus sonorensis]MEC0487122.1 hypothetical protein [Bacillus glycinifermentans]MEC0530766.1 hypothetical protein [Bacillus sonorensis]
MNPAIDQITTYFNRPEFQPMLTYDNYLLNLFTMLMMKAVFFIIIIGLGFCLFVVALRLSVFIGLPIKAEKGWLQTVLNPNGGTSFGVDMGIGNFFKQSFGHFFVGFVLAMILVSNLHVQIATNLAKGAIAVIDIGQSRLDIAKEIYQYDSDAYSKQLEYQTKDQKTKEAQNQIARMESAVQALSGNPKMEEEQKRMYEQQYAAAFKKAQQVMSGLNGQLSQEAQDNLNNEFKRVQDEAGGINSKLNNLAGAKADSTK